MSKDFKRPTFNPKRFERLKVAISQIEPMDMAFAPMVVNEYELLIMTIYKLNDLIKVTNSYTELINEILEWVLNEGLQQAVLDQLNVWLNDGTLEVLINETLFNMKLDKSEFEEYKLVINQTLLDLEQNIQSIIADEISRIDGELEDLENNKANKDYVDIELDKKADTTYVNTQLELKVNKSKMNEYVINVKDYGVVGDGVTDDTNAIKEVIELFTNFYWKGTKQDSFADTQFGFVFFFPKGKYLITDTIYLPPYCTLMGESNAGYNFHNSIFDFTTNGSVILTDFGNDYKKFALDGTPFDVNGERRWNLNTHISGPTNTNFDRFEGIKLKGLIITPKEGTRLLGGINLRSCPFALVDECYIIKSDIGIYMESNWCTNITNTALFNYNYGVVMYSHSNRIMISGCYIDHVRGTNGGGLPITRYNESDFNWLLAKDGQHMPEDYVEYTTGIYARNAWQFSVLDCSNQYWERGFLLRQSNGNIENVWIEHVRHIDFHHTRGRIKVTNLRKETIGSKMVRSTLGGTLSFDTITGPSANGDALPSGVIINDYIATSANVSFININGVDGLPSHGLPISGINFIKSGKVISNFEILTGSITETVSELVVPYPAGFDRWKTYVISCLAQGTNTTIMLDYRLGNSGIILQNVSAGTSYRIHIMRDI